MLDEYTLNQLQNKYVEGTVEQHPEDNNQLIVIFDEAVTEHVTDRQIEGAIIDNPSGFSVGDKVKMPIDPKEATALRENNDPFIVEAETIEII